MPKISQGWGLATLIERNLPPYPEGMSTSGFSLRETLRRSRATWSSPGAEIARLRAIHLAQTEAAETATEVLPTPESSGFRQIEMSWLFSEPEQLREYCGQWVVVEGEQIIAVGNNQAEADALARERGVAVPFVVYVPTESELPFFGASSPLLVSYDFAMSYRRQGPFLRPLVPIRIARGSRATDTLALVDSGADGIAAPRDLATILDVDLRALSSNLSRGTAGNVTTWYVDCQIEALGMRFESSIAILDNPHALYLLGREPFFGLAQIGFRESRREIYFSARP